MASKEKYLVWVNAQTLHTITDACTAALGTTWANKQMDRLRKKSEAALGKITEPETVTMQEFPPAADVQPKAKRKPRKRKAAAPPAEEPLVADPAFEDESELESPEEAETAIEAQLTLEPDDDFDFSASPEDALPAHP